MELSGMHFVYAGVSSRLYNLIFANVTTERTTALVGEASSINVFNKASKRNQYIGERYDDSCVRFDAEVVTDDDSVINPIFQRLVEKWLFQHQNYRKLYIDTADAACSNSYDFVNGEYRQTYLNCRFINPERLEYNGGVVGYKFTIECDSCMAWQDPVVYDYALGHASESSSSVITVVPDTDLNDYIYPTVTITMGPMGGDVTLVNNSDDTSRLTSFIQLTPGTKVIMKGDGLNYISGDNYTKFSNRNFIRLKDGENKISVIGNVGSVSFEFQNRRFI